MRPDQHKKKRSAQYQKKHGGAAAKGGKDDTEKRSSKSEKAVPSRAEKNHQAFSDKLKLDGGTSSSESEDEQQSAGNKSFRRREITSNWSKYDLPPPEADDSNATPKGKDFNKLLLSSGSALAHFRFKDEEGWEDDVGDMTGLAAQVLSLDCAELATSLNCLPVYTQLRLDTDVFTPEQMSAMEASADENRQLAGLPPLDRPEDPSTVHLQPHTGLSEASAGSQAQGDAGTASAFSSPPSQDVVKSHPSENALQLTETKASQDISHKGAAVSQAVSGAGFSDADLDALLMSDDAGHKVSDKASATSPAHGASQVKGEVTEQDLDDLLAMETPQICQPGVSNTSHPVKESNTAAESAELEDWLDSVLDD